MIAKVSAAAASYGIDKPFDYFVPAALRDSVHIGSRVRIPFGRGNKKSDGIVLALSETNGVDMQKIKPILSVYEDYPIYGEQMIRLAHFMRERYFCTFFDAAKCLTPAGMWKKLQIKYSFADGITEQQAAAAAGKSQTKRKIMECIAQNGGSCERSKLLHAVDCPYAAEYIRELKDKGILISEQKEKDAVSAKTCGMAELALPFEQAKARLEESGRRLPVYFDVIEFLQKNGQAAKKEIQYNTGASASTIATLARRGIIRLFEQQVYRKPSECEFSGREADGGQTVFNSEQSAALDGLKRLFDDSAPRVALLHGITGSGKTKIYIEMIKHALTAGRTAIMLVPEIALTPQLWSEITAVFGSEAAVIHSALSAGERYDEWKRIRSGQAKVVLGTRSAVFAPAENPGIIIIDEEQERTYQSEESPRYDAREIAKFRIARSGGLLVLGSATPSVESYYNAEQGVYSLFKLEGRYGGVELPEVMFADMRGTPDQGGAPTIGATLREQLEQNLKKGEQSVLFLNRRGTSRQITCMECGYIPECGHCSAPLRYHEANRRLMCHYCGYSEKMPDRCPRCGSVHLRHGGAGTQKAESELAELFPQARIIRMDADTTSAKQSHQKLLEQIYSGSADILIGTQMITKGLDFDNVTLAGIIDADASLYSGDFRAAERTFSLITQVIGRAGRRKKRGRAVIQTYTPDNPVLRAAAAQDYEALYRREIEVRRALDVPPLADLITFSIIGRDETQLLKRGMALVGRMKSLMNGEFSEIKTEVLGPVPYAVLKINDKYRYYIVFRGRQSHKLRAFVSGLLREFAAERANRGITIYADRNSGET